MKTATDGTSAEDRAFKRVLSDPVSRRRFLAVGGGSGAMAAFLAACGDDEETTSTTESTMGDSGAAADDLSMFGEGDLGVVNYALTLEYLEADFYAQVAGSGLFKGDDLALVKEIQSNEDEHVLALTATAKKLGGQPAPKPKTEFPLDSAESVLELAATVENLGAAAYLGQAGAIESPDVLAAALSIHTVEARHAAALNVLTGQDPTPDGAFAVPADSATVLEAVKPFIVA